MTAPATSPAHSPQAAQAGLAAVVAAQIPGMLPHLDVHDLAGSRQALLILLADLSRRYGAAAATLAVNQYDSTRAAAGIGGRFTAVPAEAVAVEQVGKSLQWAMSGLYGPTPDVAAFETKLTGVAEKLALDPGRDTIVQNVQRDPKARGWARIPEPAPCAFCALLATRGAVYKEDTSGFKSHDHCRCHAEPVFGQYKPSEQIRQWQELYASTRHGKPAAIRAGFRRAFDAQAS
jgi:hypothetical protein